MTARNLERVLFRGYIVLLVWLPIPLGSNRVWAWSMLELAVFALLAGCLVLRVLPRDVAAEMPIRMRAAFVTLAAWMLYQTAYVVPLPLAWVAAISPEAGRMQGLTGTLAPLAGTATLAVDRDATMGALLKGAAYSGLFLLTIALVNRRARVLLLANVLVYAAVLHAWYAVLAHLSGLRVMFFGTDMDHRWSASGTFVNRNHFAGYLEMMLALGIGLLIAGLTDRRAGSWKRFAAHTIEWILSPKMVLRLALCVLVIALTTTHSRMGNTAFFSSLLIAGVIGIALSRHATRNTVILLASLVVIDLAIVGSWFGVEKLAQRLQETTVQDVELREEPAAYAIGIVKDYPIFGSGPGSFYTVFPRYRPETVRAFFDHAHNDYIEIAADNGIVGLAILGLFVVMSLAAALKAQWLRRDPLMRGMSFACIMGVTSILIHSWVDFNLQIPANAAYFMVLLALGWISLHLGRREQAEEQ